MYVCGLSVQNGTNRVNNIVRVIAKSKLIIKYISDYNSVFHEDFTTKSHLHHIFHIFNTNCRMCKFRSKTGNYKATGRTKCRN